VQVLVLFSSMIRCGDCVPEPVCPTVQTALSRNPRASQDREDLHGRPNAFDSQFGVLHAVILSLTMLVRWEYQRTRRQDRRHDTEKGR